MVKRVRSATALCSSGIADWLMQRVSAIIVLAYFFFLVAFYLMHPVINFELWHGLFSHFSMRFFSLLALLALLAHAWIGIWTVLTDYVKNTYLRGALQIIIIIAFLACLTWGIQIFWS
jgi:succinate dehydrogenase / fumarate reductase membrane anchor subunit